MDHYFDTVQLCLVIFNDCPLGCEFKVQDDLSSTDFKYFTITTSVCSRILRLKVLQALITSIMTPTPPSKDVPYLRTTDSRFANLPDFPYTPKYIQYGNLRMAYIDERSDRSSSDPPSKDSSPEDEETFLCLHGQPTWSYLYRRMIQVLLNYQPRGSTTSSANANPHLSPHRRVLAPDLFGFGRSDKPTSASTYTYTFHRASLLHFISTLDLRNITLVVQDWGGLLGLTLPLFETFRYKRLIVMNTTLATGVSPGKGFLDWRDFSNKNPDMEIGKLIGRGAKHVTSEEMAAYDAPFPDARYKEGVRRFPNLVMVSPEMDGVGVSREAVEFYRGKGSPFGQGGVVMACGMKDPVLGPGVMQGLAKVWRDGCWYFEVKEAGHFVQEWGGEVARVALEVFAQGVGEGVEGVRKIQGGGSQSKL